MHIFGTFNMDIPLNSLTAGLLLNVVGVLTITLSYVLSCHFIEVDSAFLTESDKILHTLGCIILSLGGILVLDFVLSVTIFP